MPAVEKLAALAAVLIFFAAGWGLGELLPAVRRLRAGVRHAYLYLLGVAWVAGGIYALSHLFAIPLRRPLVLILALVPVAAGLAARWARRRRSGAVVEASPASAPPAGGDLAVAPSTAGDRLSAPARAPAVRRRRPRLLAAMAWTLALAVSLAVLAEVVSRPLHDWDGRMTWTTQARYVREAGTVDAPVLRGREWFVTLTHYPLLLPLTQVATMELAGAGDDDPAGRPPYALFLPVFFALLWGGVRRSGSTAAAAYTVLAASLLPFLAFYPGGGANSSYSDLPLACFYGGALLLLLAPRLEVSSGVAGGLLLGAAVLAKDEGAPLAFAALVLAAATLLWRQLRSRRRRRRRGRPEGPRSGGRRAFVPLLIAAGCVLAASALLASWRAGIPLRNTPDYRGFLARDGLLKPLVERTPMLLGKVRFEMIDLRHWGIFWSVVPVVLVAGRRGLRRSTTLALALAALAPLALIGFVYLITDLPTELPRMTWNRFLVQAGIPIFVLFGWALADLLRRARWLPRALRGR
jgi:hypothetical protein